MTTAPQAQPEGPSTERAALAEQIKTLAREYRHGNDWPILKYQELAAAVDKLAALAAPEVPAPVGAPFGWFYEMASENPNAGPVYLGSSDQNTTQIVANDDGKKAFPLYAAEPVAHTTERHIALREGHAIKSEDDYFDARPRHDTQDRRHYFRAGFERGFDAGEKVYTSPPPAAQEVPQEVVSAAARDVLAERRRQVEAEGWTPEHDDEHSNGVMATASACYALAAAAQSPDIGQSWRMRFANAANDLWQWDREWWKPSDPRRMLVKAGALILAEIERLDRALASPAAPEE